MEEVNIIRPNFKAIKMAIITLQLITKVIVDSFITHAKVTIKGMDIANLVAEAAVMAEVITMHVDTAGVISEAIIIITTSSSIPMIMIPPPNSMVHHVLLQ